MLEDTRQKRDSLLYLSTKAIYSFTPVILCSKSNKMSLGYFHPRTKAFTIKIHDFQDDLTNILAKIRTMMHTVCFSINPVVPVARYRSTANYSTSLIFSNQELISDSPQYANEMAQK